MWVTSQNDKITKMGKSKKNFRFVQKIKINSKNFRFAKNDFTFNTKILL